MSLLLTNTCTIGNGAIFAIQRTAPELPEFGLKRTSPVAGSTMLKRPFSQPTSYITILSERPVGTH